MSGSININIADSFMDFCLERTTHNLELRSLPSRKQVFTRDKSEAIKFIKQHEKENLYFGAASRNGGGKAENTRELPFLFADLDFKTFPGGEQEARQQLDSFPLEPSIVIHSGNGLHDYWLLSEKIENAYEERARITRSLQGIAEALKSDPQVCDCARVMRLPGSLNFKTSPPKPVTVEKWDTTLSYAHDAFSLLHTSTSLYSYSYRQSVTDSVTLFTEGRRDTDLFHVANQLAKSGTSEKVIAQVIEILAKNCTPPFPQNEIKTKILSAIKRQEHREVNLTREVERWISVTNGDISVTEALQELQSVTGVTIRDKTTFRQIFKRLKERGVIEKSGQRDGVYRRVMNECETIDFMNASTAAFSIAWPFQIERYVKTHPKNIIVIAGSPNSGKTAFLLNTINMNMDKHKINYFSSEMGPIELKERLSKFNIPLSDFKKKVEWLERSGSFADVIRPDEINVIDYLEMTDQFYLIAEYIKNIFEKLRTGIAIIAIQKNPGVALGLGGARSLEKARLYITMDSHTLKIEKGKNWTDPAVNPNGLEIRFKLTQGCNFFSEGNWHKGATA